MTKFEFEQLFIEAMTAGRAAGIIPRDTGNLSDTAIRQQWVSDSTYRIWIDESIAPYAKHTIERWRSGENLNEGWLERLVEYLVRYISIKVGGSYVGS